jgi:hypothetical protein
VIDVAENSGPFVRKEILPREKTMAKLAKPARDRISATKFAFPRQHKESPENASHVRNAVARSPGEERYGSGTSSSVEAEYSWRVAQAGAGLSDQPSVLI